MTREYIIETCEEYGIRNYTINDDLSIDVNGSVSLSYKRLTELPLVFNIVKDNFYCHNNNLTSLKGAPRKCKYFYCYYNNLATLRGAPRCKYIAADYDKLNLDNEDLYIIEALANWYDDKELQDYLKIRKRNEFINSILD